MPMFEEMGEAADTFRRYAYAAKTPWPEPPEQQPDDGYLPLGDAARVMGVDEPELRLMVRRGELEAHEIGGRILVRPAIVSKLGVRTLDRRNA